jgi:hypothetical protein
MSDKRYQLVYVGKLKHGMDAETVKSNLVLSIGISEEKANQLIQPEPKMLKHFATAVEAQRLAEKFDQAGIVCVVRDSIGSSDVDTGSGESSLLSVLKKQASGTDEENSSMLNRLFNERQRSRRA